MKVDAWGRALISGVQCSTCRKYAVPVYRRFMLGSHLKGELIAEPPEAVCNGPTEKREALIPVDRFKAWRFRTLWHGIELHDIKRRGHSPTIVWAPTTRWADQFPRYYDAA